MPSTGTYYIKIYGIFRHIKPPNYIGWFVQLVSVSEDVIIAPRMSSSVFAWHLGDQWHNRLASIICRMFLLNGFNNYCPMCSAAPLNCWPYAFFFLFSVIYIFFSAKMPLPRRSSITNYTICDFTWGIDNYHFFIRYITRTRIFSFCSMLT